MGLALVGQRLVLRWYFGVMFWVFWGGVLGWCFVVMLCGDALW
jgi:hypothetical protein